MKARRARVIAKYQGVDITSSLEPYLTSFSFADNEGSGDDIQINLQDHEGKWHGSFMPSKGDEIQAIIEVVNWKGDGQVKRLDCGKFFIDAVDFKGPPDTLTIKALSIPIKKSGKNARNSRMWEKVTLSKVAGDIAISAGLELMYDAPDYIYDRVEQIRETDLAFIKKRAKKEGIAVKVSNGYLILYDEASYEAKETVRTIKRGESDIISYSFAYETADKEYQKVEISYWDDVKKANIKYVYTVPNVEEGPTLKLNERAKSLAEAIRITKNAARNRNKGAWTGKLTMLGDPTLIQGVTINIEGFLKFDGKYYIESTTHDVGDGYLVNLNIREVLPY
ncbi:phage late control D family protein [Lysinibacillus telephonicus]|uniref:phage late control D family protein n=1 Tax=Lysinibacillus telephonicus TaxID=1714840 RepID=UPI003B9F9783